MLLFLVSQLIIQMFPSLLRRRLNLTLQLSQVVQAHTLGEVDNLGTVLLRVYSGTVLLFFIEIGLYFTDKEQNICWQFFWTRCISRN